MVKDYMGQCIEELVLKMRIFIKKMVFSNKILLINLRGLGLM